MKEKIYDARTRNGICFGGDIICSLELHDRPIGRWGMLHKAYLKLRKPAYYQSLLLSGKAGYCFGKCGRAGCRAV